MKKLVPEDPKPNANLDANITQRNDQEGVSRDNAGNIVEDSQKDLISNQSNALSNDTSGATQFVNLDTHHVTKDDHMVPDSTNTVETTVEKSQEQIASESPVYEAGVDKREIGEGQTAAENKATGKADKAGNSAK